MAWSPLASGLLSGKYRPSEGVVTGDGRLQALAGSGNPAFEKFTDRNWAIVSELEKVADEAGRSMAQVALNWVANRPGVASVLVGASKVSQLEDNLRALDFELDPALTARLDGASLRPSTFPYFFFQPAMQRMITGGATVGDKPPSYRYDKTMAGRDAGIGAEQSSQD